MILPPLTLKNLNKCSQSFSVRHGLSCSHRVLIIARHNEVYDKILYIDCLAFPYNYVHGEPLIHQCHRRPEEEVRQGDRGLETRGDVLI